MSVRFLGILMLDTRFPRIPGDVGHAASWTIPVRYAVVQGASPQRVVRDGDPALLQPFIDAARGLVSEGAKAITTSCGFLVQFQAELQAALPVPVWTSSLLKLPELQAPGVLTVDAESLNSTHLRAAGAAEDTPVEGLTSGCGFQRTLLDNLPLLDTAAAEAETVAAARRLLLRYPLKEPPGRSQGSLTPSGGLTRSDRFGGSIIRSLVLECTNMPPYATAVRAATGLPVHHLLNLVHERWQTLPAP